MKIDIRIFVIVLSFFFINNLHSQTGETHRTIINFDAGWSFKKNITPWTWRYKYESANWEKVNLPHDWSIKGPFNKEEPSGGYGAYLPTGTGVYRKSFTLDKSMNDKIITIEFDGVYMNSEVYCNGGRSCARTNVEAKIEAAKRNGLQCHQDKS